jgi:hypothetical protein
VERHTCRCSKGVTAWPPGGRRGWAGRAPSRPADLSGGAVGRRAPARFIPSGEVRSVDRIRIKSVCRLAFDHLSRHGLHVYVHMIRWNPGRPPLPGPCSQHGPKHPSVWSRRRGWLPASAAGQGRRASEEVSQPAIPVCRAHRSPSCEGRGPPVGRRRETWATQHGLGRAACQAAGPWAPPLPPVSRDSGLPRPKELRSPCDPPTHCSPAGHD